MQAIVSGNGTGRDTDGTGRAATVLAVDDDPIQRELYGIYLGPPDIRLVTAGSGEAALELIGSAAFAAAIVDYDMPGMNGLELVRRLRADPRFATQPIVMVTGRDDLIGRNPALESGATALVYKPVDWRGLAELVRSLVAKAG